MDSWPATDENVDGPEAGIPGMPLPALPDVLEVRGVPGPCGVPAEGCGPRGGNGNRSGGGGHGGNGAAAGAGAGAGTGNVARRADERDSAGQAGQAGQASDPGHAGPVGRRGGSRPGPFRVVIADDADSLRELLCLLFDTEPDFTVVGWAADGAEAVEVVARTAPDLVLLDVAMPVLDGIGALPRVRLAVPDARVVIFTGFSEAALREEVLALGADDLVEKGLSTSALVDQLRQMCRVPRPV